MKKAPQTVSVIAMLVGVISGTVWADGENKPRVESSANPSMEFSKILDKLNQRYTKPGENDRAFKFFEKNAGKCFTPKATDRTVKFVFGKLVRDRPSTAETYDCSAYFSADARPEERFICEGDSFLIEKVLGKEENGAINIGLKVKEARLGPNLIKGLHRKAPKLNGIICRVHGLATYYQLSDMVAHQSLIRRDSIDGFSVATPDDMK